MRTYYATFLRPGTLWNPDKTAREQLFWDEHARFMDALVDAGFIVLGGPVGGEREILHAIEAPSEQAVRERLAQDNWHQNGMLTIKSVEPWKVLSATGRSKPKILGVSFDYPDMVKLALREGRFFDRHDITYKKSRRTRANRIVPTSVSDAGCGSKANSTSIR